MVAAVDTDRDVRTIPGIGRLEFKETEHSRSYWLLPEGGKRRTRLPSVTTILGGTWPKPGLLEWYRRHGADAVRLRDEAAARGTHVHSFVESFMRTGDIRPVSDFPTDCWPYLQGVARFLWEFQPAPVAIERLVCHPELNYAGRLDLIADVNGATTLLDFKTNPEGRIYPQAHVQATAYALANERCGDGTVQATLLVGVTGDGNYNAIVGSDGAKVWASTLDFYRQMARFKKDMNGG